MAPSAFPTRIELSPACARMPSPDIAVSMNGRATFPCAKTMPRASTVDTEDMCAHAHWATMDTTAKTTTRVTDGHVKMTDSVGEMVYQVISVSVETPTTETAASSTTHAQMRVDAITVPAIVYPMVRSSVAAIMLTMANIAKTSTRVLIGHARQMAYVETSRTIRMYANVLQVSAGRIVRSLIFASWTRVPMAVHVEMSPCITTSVCVQRVTMVTRASTLTHACCTVPACTGCAGTNPKAPIRVTA